jgi:hypothetical protein
MWLGKHECILEICVVNITFDVTDFREVNDIEDTNVLLSKEAIADEVDIVNGGWQ